MNRKISCNQRWSLAWFREWIKKNDAGLIIEKDLRREEIFYFKNITHSIEICVKSNEIIIAAVYRGICWDILKSIELYPRKNEHGFFCSECRITPSLYYGSLKELYLAHNCDDILKWYRDNIIIGRFLYLLRTRNRDCTWGVISTDTELKDESRFIVKKYPLFEMA